MAAPEVRRTFLQRGAAMGLLAAGTAATPAGITQAETREGHPEGEPAGADRLPERFRTFARDHPSFGGPPGSDQYLGKLVPGRRRPGLAPVPVQAPDLVTLEGRMVGGVKEYHLVCEHVRRELLPGYWMDFFGYNGGMPGPIIEATQGDRVRIVVHNRLPEPTTVHWHGFELPVEMDGVPGVTQDPIPPGGEYVYEFDLHQAGTFFYHSHIPMQEALGMVGFFIIHPAAAWAPPVDRDFLLLFQNFQIPENQTVPDTMAMDWNWHTINGRSGPYATPLVCRLGERVRVRILDFSPQQHHPIHLHGHTFWITGHEGARIPPQAWVPRNNELIGVAQATDLEFIAFNPGDWLLHCHMVHHMMNHMVKQVGPRVRRALEVADFRSNLDDRPRVPLVPTDPGFRVPGYPQKMQGTEMSTAAMEKVWGRREVQGMRPHFSMGLHGLMTVVRVLPDDLYRRVMESDEEIPKGAIFDAIVQRRKDGSGSPAVS